MEGKNYKMQNNMLKKSCIMIAGFLLIDILCWITRFLDGGSIRFIIVIQAVVFIYSLCMNHNIGKK